jgi:hypothetical protein
VYVPLAVYGSNWLDPLEFPGNRSKNQLDTCFASIKGRFGYVRYGRVGWGGIVAGGARCFFAAR